MKILRAIGLGITIIILKFLMSNPFTAFESSLVALFGAAETSFSHIEDVSLYTNMSARALIPQ